ncbi:MAG TPA: alanyl-tRNA editing protein [Bryobacteraceae bacterium]|jgi:alanyl-tRNA synthetase
MLGVSTERLYYRDSYLSVFEAQICKELGDPCRIYLNRTAFYPTSGGQPHDLGTLGGQPVVEVVDEGDRIAHVTAAPLVSPSNTVAAAIDWARRYDHMQQHTGQHLLSAVFAERFGYQTLSFHMGGEVSTIELGTPELNDAQMNEVERQANLIANESRPVHIRFEDPADVAGLRKASERAGTLRVVEIEGLDRSACGGTHVRSSSETAPLQIRKVEKIRGNVRLDFVCGLRAVARAKQDFRLLSALARQSATPIDKLPEQFAALRLRLTAAEKDRQRLSMEAARREGEELYSEASLSPEGIRRAKLHVPAIDEAVRAKAQAFTAQPKAVLLVLAEDPPGVLIACSPDASLNAGAILKQVLSAAGGRGGGAATLAQGSLPNAQVGNALADALGF